MCLFPQCFVCHIFVVFCCITITKTTINMNLYFWIWVNLFQKKIGIPLIFQDWSNRHWSCHETQTYIYIRELCVFLCATWPTTRDSLRYVTWLMSRDSIVYIFVHPMYFYARHDCISMRDMTHNSDSLRYVTWLLTRDSIVYIYSCILCISMHNMTHNSRLIKTCDMTHDSWLNRKYIVVHSM